MILSHELRGYWSPTRKLVFRFVFLYFLSYILFTYFGRLFFESLFVWVGKNILQSEGRLAYFSTGSGDTTMAYISWLVQSSMTIVGLLVWSLLDRKRPSYNQLFYWFIVILRMYLIIQLFIYGFAKVFKGQFPGPSLTRLLQPIGEMSPMGLAWTYMGHSEGFNMFVGGMEVLGGLLLIPRKTITLGAIVTTGVMLQVLMMNLFYDIPVKLFSAHLMAMAFVIFAADWKRCKQVFIKNETAQAINYYEVSEDSHYKKIIFWLKIILTLFLGGAMSWQGYHGERTYGDKREKPALYGIWEANTFVKNKDTLPPLITDATRLRYLIIDRKGSATLQFMDDQKKRMTLHVDTIKKQLTLYEGEWELSDNFTYTHSDDRLHIKGKLYGDTLDIHLKAKDLRDFELINREFHWINETPYNR
ncbi:hypothetical protein [uncultured Dokdonia sp.]|uniref:hypothetical protein n=1 Tax=uncultured Dokdonia sp. TaxID=575653 RepID=UPI002629F00F|nr:hypothetical protein [uncultured Dokdonia sp.]